MKLLGTGVLALLCCSCSFLASFDPLQVTGYSPQADQLAPGSQPTVSLSFSQDPDHAKAENAFSLTLRSLTVAGDFSWSGPTLTFRPFQSLVEGCTYEMKMDTTVETAQGNSLTQAFQHRFVIGPPATRPLMVSSTPANHGTLASASTPLVVSFSQPMDRASALGALSLTPSTGRTLDWDPSGQVLTLTPQASWPVDQEIQLHFTTDLKDIHQQALGEALDLRFTYPGTGQAPPTLIQIANPSATLCLAPPANQGQSALTTLGPWPMNSDLWLTFSQPVSISSLQSQLTSSFALDYTIQDPLPYSATVKLHWNTPLAWNKLVDFTLKAGVSDQEGKSTLLPYRFWVRTNDNSYRPPLVTGLSWQGLALTSGQSLTVTTSTYNLRVYLSQGTASQFQLASFLSHLSLTAQGGYAVDLRNLEVESTDTSDPTQKVFCLKLTVQVTLPTGTPMPSLFTIALSKAYQDDLGNSPLADYQFLVFFTAN